MYGTIAVGTDGSETAAIAEGVALELAGTSGGRVLFVSAFKDDAARGKSAEAVETARARSAGRHRADRSRTGPASSSSPTAGTPSCSSWAMSVWVAIGRSVSAACPTVSRTTCRVTC